MNKFKAKQKLPFNIKKGDVITEVKTGVFHNEKGEVIPFNPRDEKEFFQLIEEYKPKYPIDSEVMFKKQIVCKEHQGEMVSTKSFTLPAWTPFKVVGVVKRYQKPHLVVKFNKTNYEVAETDVFLYDAYWFINSSGKVCPSIKGKDEKADIFRVKSKNYFHDSASANKQLMKINSKELVLIASTKEVV